MLGEELRVPESKAWRRIKGAGKRGLEKNLGAGKRGLEKN